LVIGTTAVNAHYLYQKITEETVTSTKFREGIVKEYCTMGTAKITKERQHQLLMDNDVGWFIIP
jgi:hypothetical protein